MSVWYGVILLLTTLILLAGLMLFFSQKKINIFWSCTGLSIGIGILLWELSNEPLVIFYLAGLLVADISLLLFASMLDTKTQATDRRGGVWSLAASIWLLCLLGAAGFWAIWEGSDAVLGGLGISQQALVAQFQRIAWQAFIPYLVVSGLLLLIVSVGSFLLFQADKAAD